MAERLTFGDRMAALKNRRHELFAQSLAKGKSQEEAYREAGYTPSRPHASRLATDGNVSARVSELQERAAVSVEINAELISRMLMEDRTLAHKMGQASAAVSAAMGLAKLAGLIIDKAQNENTNREAPPMPTRDDIEARKSSWDEAVAGHA